MQTNQKPLTILQVASGFPGWGGTELHILNLSQQLTIRGHNVTVACRPDGWVWNKALEMGLKTFDATVLRQHDWHDYKRLQEFCTRNHVDVVHTHWSTDAVVPAFAGRMAGVPVRLMTRHSPYPFKTILGRLLYTEILYNRILAISGSVENTLVKCGVPEEKLIVIHHGTDVGAFEKVTKSRSEARAEIGLTDEIVALGILGRIADEKGHKYLYDALMLLPNLPNLRVVVVGDGPKSDEQRQYVSENGLEQRVIFVPFRSDVNNVINALDMVTVPSTWEEPCSAVIQQAMSLAKPVIGTRVGGTPEMIVDGVTGLLANASDAASLAAAIEKLANDPKLRASQGAAGAERVRALFTLDRMTTRVEELYRQELSRTGRIGSGAGAAREEAVPA